MNMFVGTLHQGDFKHLSRKVTLRSWVMQNSMNRFYWNTTNISGKVTFRHYVTKTLWTCFHQNTMLIMCQTLHWSKLP